MKRKRLFADTLSANKKIFADTLSVNKKLFADTLSANKKLFADTQSANKKLFADTISANKNIFADTNYTNLRHMWCIFLRKSRIQGLCDKVNVRFILNISLMNYCSKYAIKHLYLECLLSRNNQHN